MQDQRLQDIVPARVKTAHMPSQSSVFCLGKMNKSKITPHDWNRVRQQQRLQRLQRGAL